MSNIFPQDMPIEIQESLLADIYAHGRCKYEVNEVLVGKFTTKKYKRVEEYSDIVNKKTGLKFTLQED